MYAFLMNFLDLHGDTFGGAGVEVFLAGESHAGHYIPHLAKWILDRNRGAAPRHVLNLAGLLVGNGWTEPRYQYAATELAHSLGLITEGQARTLDAKERQCVAALDRGSYNTRTCFGLLDDVVADSGTYSKARVSMYDVDRWQAPGDEFPPGHKALERYLNERAVRDAIHVDHAYEFLECTDPPYDALARRDGIGVSSQLEAVLDDAHRKVRVLFFNGVRDLVCNHVRTEQVLANLDWAGAAAHARAGKQVWYASPSATKPAGYVKDAGGQLAYLAVSDSGHMVPMDVPGPALDMVSRFVAGASLGDHAQSINANGPAPPPLAAEPCPRPAPTRRPTPGPTPRPSPKPTSSPPSPAPVQLEKNPRASATCTADCLRDSRVQAVLALPPALCLLLAAALAVCVRCARRGNDDTKAVHAALAQDSDDEDSRKNTTDGLDAHSDLKPHPGAEVL